MNITFDPKNSAERSIVSTIINSLNGDNLTIEKVPAPTAEPTMLVDGNGIPWNPEVHAATKNKTAKGVWTRAKGTTRKEYDDFASQFPPAVPEAPPPPPPPPAPAAAVAVAQDLLLEIDSIFADLDEAGNIEDFSAWVDTMINWAKPGAKCISDLENDQAAQETLLNHLNTL